MASKFPWFALASAVCTAIGGFGLYWYSTLSPEEQAAADGLAAEYAQSLYGAGVSELTDAQARHVNGLVKGHFPGN